MATIELAGNNGRFVFVVGCSEPKARRTRQDPPCDRELLQGIVAACPGAQMQQIRHERSSNAADGRECFEFALSVTVANVSALLATRFQWSNDAEKAAEAFAIDRVTIDKARDEAITKLHRQRNAWPRIVAGFHWLVNIVRVPR